MINAYKKIWSEIIKQKCITICTHVNPDGDTIGSAFALKHLINTFNPSIKIKISGEKAPKSLDTINELEYVSDEFFNNSQVIVIDTSSLERISDKRVITKEALNIDHHEDMDEFKIRIGGNNWPATGQVLFEMAKSLNLEINHKAAQGMFYAIWTDTEGMTQRNITETTIKAIKELGKNGIKEECISSLELPNEAEELIKKIRQNISIDKNICHIVMDIIIPEDYYRQVIARLSNESKAEVFISVFNNDKKQIRGSLRSKGNIDVSIFAKEFGGGGHFTSSGFNCKSIKEGKERVNSLLKKF